MIAASAPSAQITASSSAATAIPAAGGGSQQHYEVLLFGEFVNENGRLDAIMNRLSLVCEGGSDTVQFAEWHFHPAHRLPEEISGPSGSSLTLRRVVGSPGWILHSHLKPEPARVHSAATVRAATFCTTEGHGLAFVSALGFAQRFQLHKRGFLFRRGCLTITLLQIDQWREVDGKRKNIAAHASAPWQVECRAYTKEVPLQQAIDAVLDLQLILKGWLDLNRQE